MRLSKTLLPLAAMAECALSASFSVVVDGTASHTIPSTLFGWMFEDISSGDGGLYAEMIQNRAFQQVTPGTSSALAFWNAVGGAQISVVNTTPPLSSALPNSLQIVVPKGSSGAVGAANTGFWGINARSDWTYDASFFFKFPTASQFSGTLTMSLVASDGKTTLASASKRVSAPNSHSWQQFQATLKPSHTASNVNNTFRISLDGNAAGGETFFVTLASLFPPTFKGRKNGIRMDLAQALADTKPGFFRFPGGNNLGQSIAQRWIWNNTVGPLTDRPGRLGDWSYINTDGLGLFEYLQFIEDLGAEPIMAVWAGYSFGGTVPDGQLGPFIQEAIDQINFVVGDPSKNAAAAIRASMGHPEPFKLRFVEIGNEDFFAADTYAAYRWREFVTALSAQFPSIEFLATTNTFNPVLTPAPQLYDVHVYQTPTWFLQNAFIYDGFQRNGTKYFEGEYAAISTNANNLFGTIQDGRFPFPRIEGSVGEAAFMTGLERNSDIVFAASYAPLLQNNNRFQWTPNLITFDASRMVLSTSYYVQKQFGLMRGDEYLPSTLPSRTGQTHWSVTRDSKTGEVFIKIANAATSTSSISFSLPFSKVSSSGSALILTGAATASNTLDAPQTAVPKSSSFTAGKQFTFNAPAMSVSFLTVKTG